MSKIDYFNMDWSEGTRIAWETGFAPTIAMSPSAVSAVFGAAAFSLWRSFPGVVCIRGDRASGKTTLLNQVRDLIDEDDPPKPIASFEGSTVTGLLHAGATIIDDVPPAVGTAARATQRRISELVRFVYNGAVRHGDTPLYPPPIMFLAGEQLPLTGSAASRALMVELSIGPHAAIAASWKSVNWDARRVFAERFKEWLSNQDDASLGDEFADYALVLDSRQLMAVTFGIELLNRFLVENSAPRLELDLSAFVAPSADTALPPVLRALADAVVGAVRDGQYRLVGGTESDAPILGRIDGSKVSVVPAIAWRLLRDSSTTQTGVAASLDSHGLLNREAPGNSRTVTRRLSGKVVRLWETDGLFDDSDLAKLRGESEADTTARGHAPSAGENPVAPLDADLTDAIENEWVTLSRARTTQATRAAKTEQP